MWNWAFHVRHNWQSNLLREDIKKVETLWQKQSERKGKVPKSYEKRCHNKSRKQLTKEGAVSFLRLSLKRMKFRKYVIGKIKKQLTKEGAVSVLEAQHKSMKGRKSCHWKNYQIWTKGGCIFQLWWMKWIGKHLHMVLHSNFLKEGAYVARVRASRWLNWSHGSQLVFTW